MRTNLGNVRGPRGFSGLVKKVTVPYIENIELTPNQKNDITPLEGNLTLSLAPAEDGWDNEWIAVIRQGNTAYEVNLPIVKWGLGIAPTFEVNTTTQCCLYYIDTTLCGEWVSV